MRGRIYDPRLGRFLQADPFVQSASDMQMFNRYSYARNNPLNATDPSGYLSWKILGGFSGPAHDVIKYGKLGLVSVLGEVGTFILRAKLSDVGMAFFAGFIDALVVGLSYGLGGMFGDSGPWVQLIGEAVVQGVVGGIGSALTSGNFGKSFLSSFADSLAGGIGKKYGTSIRSRIIAGAVVGGTVSEITGGKFANVACSGAFSAAVAAASATSDRGLGYGGPSLGDQIALSETLAGSDLEIANLAQADAFVRDLDVESWLPIGSRPAGPDGPTITFINDETGRSGPTPFFRPQLKFAVEQLVRETGYDVNINSTVRTPELNPSGFHVRAFALDINRINGVPVRPGSGDYLNLVGHWIGKTPNWAEAYGPEFWLGHSGGRIVPKPGVRADRMLGRESRAGCGSE